jgi:hypothetical protein
LEARSYFDTDEPIPAPHPESFAGGDQSAGRPVVDPDVLERG